MTRWSTKHLWALASTLALCGCAEQASPREFRYPLAAILDDVSEIVVGPFAEAVANPYSHETKAALCAQSHRNVGQFFPLVDRIKKDVRGADTAPLARALTSAVDLGRKCMSEEISQADVNRLSSKFAEAKRELAGY